MRRRLASLYGEDAYDLDARRVAYLVKQIAPLYSRVHLSGVSTGGLLAVMAYERLVKAQSPLVAQVGAVVAFEGWYDTSAYVDVPEGVELVNEGWEIVFPGPTGARFLETAHAPGVTLAHGDCGAALWAPMYAGVDASHVRAYVGGHEFVPSVLLDAIAALP